MRIVTPTVALVILLASALAAAPPAKALVPVVLGLAGSSIHGQAASINNTGQIVGYGWSESRTFALLWDHDAVIRLPSLPHFHIFEHARAAGINDAGQIVGATRCCTTGEDAYHAAIWNDGVVSDLGTYPGGYSSFANAISNNGRIVGYGDLTPGGFPHALLWAGGTVVNLGTLPGDGGSEAKAINARGEVVGISIRYGPTGIPIQQHAFIWYRGTMRELGTLGGVSSEALGINNRGQVVGWSDTAVGGRHAVIWDNGTILDLGALPGGTESTATAINERGQVVGWSHGNHRLNPIHPGPILQLGFVWDKGTMTPLVPPGDPANYDADSFSAAYAINNRGDIAGFSNRGPDGPGYWRAAVWTTPERALDYEGSDVAP